jgi:hypothetical protein
MFCERNHVEAQKLMSPVTKVRLHVAWAGLVKIAKFNLNNWRGATPAVRAVFVVCVACSACACWYVVENSGQRVSFSEACKAKCVPLSFRVEKTLMNPFIGEDQRRNIREVRCVCGTAP